MTVLNDQASVNSQPLFVTLASVEAAFQSGAFYAKHKIKAKALNVELLEFGFAGQVENAIPFAVATTVAIYDAIAGLREYTPADLAGWEVIKIERTGST